jgi:hypothetical protein
MLDEQMAIICQTVSKALIPFMNEVTGEEAEKHFDFWVNLIEKRATLPEIDEWVNTGTPITKEFWNLTPQNQTKWITEWGRPMPVISKVGRKEWFIHVQRKNMDKFKKVFADFEASLNKDKQ